MQIRQWRRLSIVLPTVLLLLSVSVAGYVFLPGLMASRLINLVARESSIAITPEQAHYSLFTGELVVQGAEVTVSEAMTIRSEEVRLAAGFSSIWQEQLYLSEIQFRNSEINIDLDQAGESAALQSHAQLLASHPVLVFDEGYLAVRGRDLWASELLETAFDQIRLEVFDTDALRIGAQGISDEAVWTLNGDLDTEALQFAGQLLVEEVPLESTAGILLQECASCSFQGSVNSDLILTWSRSSGLELSGDLSIGQGSGEIPGGAALNWESLAVSGFSSQRGYGKARSLTFNHLNVRLPGDKLQAVFSSLQEQSAVQQSIELKDSRLIFSLADRKSYLSSVSGRLLPGKQHTLNFDLHGKWCDKSSVSVTGTASEKETAFQVSAGPVDMALLSEDERVIAGYDLAGTRFHLGMKGRLNSTGIAGNGKLVIDQLHNTPLNNDVALDLNFLAALMTGVEGKISTPFVLDKTPFEQLPIAVAKDIEKYWSSVVGNPQAYLSSAVAGNQKLATELVADPGKEQLTSASVSALKTLSQVLSARPELRLSIQGGVSQPRDWPVLARAELESDLRELYSAMSRDRVANNKPRIIPEEVRERLVEQMYLRTQKRKQPEIGPKSAQQRVEVAEQWLLENWPVKPEPLIKLAQDRAKVTRDVLLNDGVNASRLRLEPVVIKESLSPVTLRFTRPEQP